MIVDFHVHTTRGSADSNLDPFAMIGRAAAVGLEGIAITEHDHMWQDPKVDSFAADHGVVLFRGIEVTTELGHVGAFGLSGYVGGIYKIRELRRVADDVGGFLIANHPFRYKLDPRLRFMHPTVPENLTPEGATAMTIFQFVDEIEVVNAACSEAENRFALETARACERRGIGGSDSHDANSLGYAATVLEQRCTTVGELINELKARRFQAAHGLLQGDLRPFV
jgi:predicted metal-dependent phosphoesterase TrpH